jgi:hypothetical protein
MASVDSECARSARRKFWIMSYDVQLTPAASHSPAAAPPNLEQPHDNLDDHENTHVTARTGWGGLYQTTLVCNSYHAAHVGGLDEATSGIGCQPARGDNGWS